MKRFTLLRFAAVSAAMLVSMSIASRAFAAVDAFIVFKSADGQETKVKLNSDGTFTTPPMKAGTYKWSFGATQSGPRAESSAMGSGRVAASSSSGGDRPSESLSFNFTKIEMKYEPQRGSRDAASGMATGKRMHKPITITKELDRSSPMLYNADLGTVVVDADGDGISGTVSAVTKSGGRMGWDIAVQKKM